jgi:limonene-1,2-epoxide hydrolase
LNLEPHVCYSGALPLEPLSQSVFVLGIFEVESHKQFTWSDLKL